MKKITLFLACFLMLGGLSTLRAEDYVKLTFNLNNQATLSGVTTTLTPTEGITLAEGASVELGMSLTNQNGAPIESPTLLGISISTDVNNTILCPNTNIGNGGSATLTFTISGLPKGLNCNKIGFKGWALNSSGEGQFSDRKFDLNFTKDGNSLATFTELLIPGRGNGSASPVVKEATVQNVFTPDENGNLVITLGITDNDANGCYFGISELTLYKELGYDVQLDEKIKAFEATITSEEPLAGYVNGYPTTAIEKAKEKLNEAKGKLATPETITEADVINLQAAIDALANATKITFDANAYYMFINTLPFATDKAMLSTGTDLRWNSKVAGKHTQVWKLRATDTDGAYKVQNGDGTFITVKDGSASSGEIFFMQHTEASASPTTFTPISGVSYKINIAGKQAAHANGHSSGGGSNGSVIAYGTNISAEDASAWKLLPVTGYDVYTVEVIGVADGYYGGVTRTSTSESAYGGGFFLTNGTIAAEDVTAIPVYGHSVTAPVVDEEAKKITVTYTHSAASFLASLKQEVDAYLAMVEEADAEFFTVSETHLTAVKGLDWTAEATMDTYNSYLATFNACKEAPFTNTDLSGKYIYLLNKDRSGYYVYANTSNNTLTGTQQKDTYHMWTFVKVEGQDNAYKLYNERTGLYAKALPGNDNVAIDLSADPEEAHTYTVEPSTYVGYIRLCGGTSGGDKAYMHMAGGHKVVRWDATNGASQFKPTSVEIETYAVSLLATANAAIAKQGVGTPAEGADVRTALSGAIATTTAPYSITGIGPLEDALSSYLNSADVVKPEPGKAYRLKNVKYDATTPTYRKVYMSVDGKALEVGDVDHGSAEVFVCAKDANNRFAFFNMRHGSALCSKGEVGGYNAHIAAFELISMHGNTSGTQAGTAPYGSFFLKTPHRNADGTGDPTSLIVNSSDEFANDNATAPLYNTAGSNIYELEEVTETAYNRHKITFTKLNDEEHYVATYSAPYPTVLPEGVSAFTVLATGNGVAQTISLEGDGTAIPANIGVLLAATEPIEPQYMAPATGETALTVSGENLLTGTMGASVVLNNVYILANAASGVGFYNVKNGSSLGAFRAYLNVPVTNDARALRLSFGDESGELTGIEGVEAETPAALNQKIYDLSGRVVRNPQKGGLYIKGGKKFIQK